MIRTVSKTQLRKEIFGFAERAARQPETAVSFRIEGGTAVALVDARYYEGLLATLELLADPDAVELLQRGLEDEKAGRMIPHEQVRRELGLHGKSKSRRRVDRNGKPVAARNR